MPRTKQTSRISNLSPESRKRLDEERAALWGEQSPASGAKRKPQKVFVFRSYGFCVLGLISVDIAAYQSFFLSFEWKIVLQTYFLGLLYIAKHVENG